VNRFLIFLACFLLPVLLSAQEMRDPLTPGGAYDPLVPAPAAVLGFVPGDRPARYDQVVSYIRKLAETSPRVRLMEMGRSTEGRQQYYLAIALPDRLQRLEQIQQDAGRLADPRTLDASGAQGIAKNSPAVVWIGYGIHGDELSSVDAALHVAYQLAAGTDEHTASILKELVVCIDPMENPDGRERFLAQMEQWNGVVPNPDAQSLHHTGVWPYGRGNHYLFDLNRDWFTLVHPETRARVRTVLQWNPQVFIDSHEMGAYDTYLFSPPRQPINHNISPNAKQWWQLFASDQARAFDRHGWSYYTREWSDDWYPGYANSWALYTDAAGILYEQAGVEGSLVKRPDGTTLVYRETVHHHIVSSLANLGTAARHRQNLLQRFYEAKKQALTPEKGEPQAFYLVSRDNPARVERLVEKLLLQRIEVMKAGGEFALDDARAVSGGKPAEQQLPAGTYIVPMNQPMARLARAILEFDPRMLSSFLQEERKSLEKERDSKLYDVTAWSLPLAYGLEAYWSAERTRVSAAAVTAIERPRGMVEGGPAPFGYLFSYDDRGVEALAGLLQRGFKVRTAKEPFAVENHSYARGTLLVRVNENSPGLLESLRQVADSTGVVFRAVGTGLSTAGPDLGGNDFVLLQQPRILLVGGSEVGTTGFGALWHLLDSRLRIRATMMPLGALASSDLRPYNILVLPSVGDPQSVMHALGKGGVGRLREWVEGGGTLVALGNAAGFFADTASGFSGVRVRQQALKDLDLYKRAFELEQKAEKPRIDSIALWSGTLPVPDTAGGGKSEANEKDLAMQDERARMFMPRGAILRVDLDEEHWLAYGAGKSVPGLIFGSQVLVSRYPVRTPARFAGTDGLRLSGLLWPEARDRWARTAYATRESRGRGQIILFSGDPVFRGFFLGTERLLVNALLLGPGFGTNPPVGW
jgi:hypothetical protein